MNVYRVQTDLDNGFALLGRHPAPTRITAPPLLFSGDRKLPDWKTPDLAFGPGAHTDFPFFKIGALACSDRAWSVIAPLVGGDVETLPLRVVGDEGEERGGYRALNVVNVLDCLDHGSTRFKQSSRGDIVDVLDYAFRRGAAAGACLFRLPEIPFVDLYATDALRDTVLSAGLTGLTFHRVGDDGA